MKPGPESTPTKTDPTASATAPAENKAWNVAGPLRLTPEVPGPGKLRRILREALPYASRRSARTLAAARAAAWRVRARRRLARTSRPRRLCLGAGSAPIPGWINADLEPGADLRLDLRFPLPFPDGSVDFIYSEHVIEHLDLDDGLSLLAECRRVLSPAGVFRVATPDLAALVCSYQDDWRDQDWVRWPSHRWIDSAARMLNVAFRFWGHRHLYDHEELARRLLQSGFDDTRRCALGASPVLELAGLETRPDSLLIVEAWGIRSRGET